MKADVCIVGAGAAGGIMAHELGRRGVRVVVLESGPRHDFARRGEYVRRYLAHDDPWRTELPALDRHTSGGTPAYTLAGRRVRAVGGTTLHWEGYALRFHADDFRVRSLHGIADDWPLTYDDLEPYYARVEQALGVAGATDDRWSSPRSTPFPLPAFPLSYSDRVFGKAAEALGVAVQSLPQARNSVAYGGRPACRACSTCAVCPTGAKATIDLTHVPAAEATGNVRIVTEATVLALELDAAGRVGAAVYAHPDRVRRRVSARVFVLAAGAVENARLLLLSTSSAFPRGLANGSGLVGARFMSHPSIDVTARTTESVYPHRIGFSTAMSRQFAVGGNRSARAGFLVEFLNSAGMTPSQLALTSGLTGDALRRHVEADFGHRLGVRIYCEQLPDAGNAVTLDRAVTDHFGTPVPHVAYGVGRYERRALAEAQELATRMFTTLGATDVRASAVQVASHQIGTHRMGLDPRTSVVDAELRAHDVRNLYLVGRGAFVTATAAPPTPTIAALALRAAERIAAQAAD